MSDTLIQYLGLILGWGFITLGAVLILRALFADRSRGRRRCPRCWYSMQGVPSLTCPECGRRAKKEKRLFKTRRRYRAALFAAILSVLGATALYATGVIRVGWVRSLPTTALVMVCPLTLSDWDGTGPLRLVGPLRQQNTYSDVVPPPPPPGPPPPPAPPSTWREDMVAELIRRVEADDLWDWQAAILCRRLKQTAANAGQIADIIDTRGVIDRSLPMNATRLLNRRALLQSLADFRPFKGAGRSDAEDDMYTYVYGFIPLAEPIVIGPFIITWKPESTADYSQLFDAMRTATPGKPAPFDPADWNARVDLLDRIRLAKVTVSGDRPIGEYIEDLARQSGFNIRVHWDALAQVGLAPDVVIRAPEGHSGTLPDVLSRSFKAPALNREIELQWTVSAAGVEITGPGLFIYSTEAVRFRVTRVYDVRGHQSPHVGDWNMRAFTFNGRLVVSADIQTHVDFQKYLLKLGSR